MSDPPSKSQTAYRVTEQAYNKQSDRQRLLASDNLRYNQEQSDDNLAVYEGNDTVYIGWAGTRNDRNNRSDLMSDLAILTENQDMDDRFTAAQKTLQHIRYSNPTKHIVATGHSLGGALAQHAVKTFRHDQNVHDITFNAAINPLKHYGALPSKPQSRHYHIYGDIFSFIHPLRNINSSSTVKWLTRDPNLNPHSLINFKNVT